MKKSERAACWFSAISLVCIVVINSVAQPRAEDATTVITPHAQQATPARPQTPKPPFPYQEREVSYTNPADKTTLGGTLTIPAGEGRRPVVLLLPGSGPVDRNEEMLSGHKPFWVIADYLTRRGMAVLRVDDRGVGKSTSDYQAATGEELANDALAGLAFLKRQPEIDPARLGLIGDSQGGIVAALAAAKSKDVAFIVLLAAPALPDHEHGQLRIKSMLRGAGKSEEEIAQALDAHRLLLARAKENADDDALRSPLRVLLRATYPLGPLTEKDLEALAQQQLPRLRSRSVRFFMQYDPREALRQIRAPLLALHPRQDRAVGSILAPGALVGTASER